MEIIYTKIYSTDIKKMTRDIFSRKSIRKEKRASFLGN
jgi:hypothetical protein